MSSVRARPRVRMRPKGSSGRNGKLRIVSRGDYPGVGEILSALRRIQRNK